MKAEREERCPCCGQVVEQAQKFDWSICKKCDRHMHISELDVKIAIQEEGCIGTELWAEIDKLEQTIKNR